MKKLIAFFKKETVLCVAGLAALITVFFVPPSAEYIGYIDFRVLALLFCLMAVVAGLGKAGLFEMLSAKLTSGLKTSRSLCVILVLLCFFSSMAITNDVALITFVPFAILSLNAAGLKKLLIPVITLQTVAANLGSMLTPVGNPQNLYLYSRYGFTAGEFFSLTLPVTGASLLLILLGCLLIPSEKLAERGGTEVPKLETKELIKYSGLFVLCLATVFRLIEWPFMLAIVVLYLFLQDRPLFRKVDYSLLMTFVFFFIFVGNMGAMEPVRAFIGPLIEGREVLSSVLLSQVISNVPAAALLSAFTEDGAALLLGTNIGGLGTLVASLASLISYRIYCGSEGANGGKYLGFFTAVNLILLVPLTILGVML